MKTTLLMCALMLVVAGCGNTASLGNGASRQAGLSAGTGGCHRGGCSGQLCTDTPGAASTCEWNDDFACFQAAACGRQSDGTCGFTPSPALTACLGGGTAPIDAGTIAVDAGPAPCYRGGCSNQLCTDAPNAPSTCEWDDTYACFQAATCARQPSGQCGFTPSPVLTACLSGGGVDAGAAPCYRGGCSNQLCTDDPNAGSTCEWRAEYACYPSATCERQANGQCGFAQTPALTACLLMSRADAGP